MANGILEYFPFKYSYTDKFNKMSDEMAGRLIKALAEYAKTGETPKMDADIEIIFDFIADDIKRSAEKASDLSEVRSKSAKSRWGKSKCEQGDANECKTMQTDANESNGVQDIVCKSIHSNSNTNIPKMLTHFRIDMLTHIKECVLGVSKDSENTEKSEADTEEVIDNAILSDKGSLSDKESITPYREIQDAYNAICGEVFPKATALNDSRRKSINARWKEHPDIEFFQEYFRTAAKSPFLRGEWKGSTGWKANFDWLLNPNNMQKVLEGNYSERAFADYQSSKLDWGKDAVL